MFDMDVVVGLCPSGLEELVLSEISSPSRTQQTGDSSSVSSFSYRDMMKEAQPTSQNKVGHSSEMVMVSVDSVDSETWIRWCEPDPDL